MGRVWRGFCISRYKFYRSRACRGIKLIEARKLSRYAEIYLRAEERLPNVAERSWVSGCNNNYQFVLSAGAKAEEQSDENPPWRGKKCYKQLTHIVRVSGAFYLFSFVDFLDCSFSVKLTFMQLFIN